MKNLLRSPHHLTDDETTEFVGRKDAVFPCRIRVWRRQGAASVALASQVLKDDGSPHPNPGRLVGRIANYVHSAILGYPAEGFVYVEACRDLLGEWVIQHCSFSYFGRANQRLRLYEPARHAIDVASLEHMIGQRVEDLHV